MPQIHYYCIFMNKLFKNFQSSKFFVNHAPWALGIHVFGSFTSSTLSEKFGRRKIEIAQNMPITVVLKTTNELDLFYFWLQGILGVPHPQQNSGGDPYPREKTRLYLVFNPKNVKKSP